MTGSAQPTTAVVLRRVRPGAEADFETLMQQFVAFVLRQPGHLGINIIRPSAGSNEYTVLDRFATELDRQRLKSTPEYAEWMHRLRAVSEADPVIEEMGGLAFWFTLPDRPARRAPSRMKMALTTLLGVYPLSLLIPRLVVPAIPGWPGWLHALIIGALMVASLTWIVMPTLTRVLEKWLFGPEPRG